MTTSHEVSRLPKATSRGETALVDAYLTPTLRRYTTQLAARLDDIGGADSLHFMTSAGGLSDIHFDGRDAILSGPAEGIVGMVETALRAGFSSLIGFDMGGTSTDVSHYNGQYERRFEMEVAGARLRVPMMDIHTVAAGGGSILKFVDGRYQVGPESAGAFPDPASYGNDGPLTVTDCNVVLGRLQPEHFPQVFGETGRTGSAQEIRRLDQRNHARDWSVGSRP